MQKYDLKQGSISLILCIMTKTKKAVELNDLNELDELFVTTL